MGILVLLAFLAATGLLAMLGRTADSRDGTGRCWSLPFTAGRDPTLHPRHCS